MGVFDFFSRKNNRAPSYPVNDYYDNKDELSIRRTLTPEGYMQIDYTEPSRRSYGKCTRLVLEPNPETIKGVRIYTGKVSWYNVDDAIMFNGDDSRHRGPKIRLEVDPYLLKDDDTYTEVVMKGLLSRDRVAKYLQYGLSTNPEIKCGNYIGGVMLHRNGKYAKVFDERVGEHVHDMPEIVSYRERYLEQKRRNGRIEQRRRQLLSELDELNRQSDTGISYTDWDPYGDR